MATLANTPSISTSPVHPALFRSSVSAKPIKISWEQFEKRFLTREDQFKYEWVNGLVVKTPRTMNQQQQFIWLNLKLFLEMLRASNSALGELIPEVDTFFGASHRRPDIAYFSPEQIGLLRQGNQVPQFVVEIISGKDQLNAAHEKMEDYRNADIPVVWHVFPKLHTIHIYRGKDMRICTKGDNCSAEPVIPGFVLPVEQVFK